MKTLIVYFSFTGNNKMIAKEMARVSGADLLEVREPKKRGMFKIMMDLLFNRFPKIEEVTIQFENYEQIILMAPIWNYQIAHPMKTFIRNYKEFLKDYSFVTLCTGRDRQKEKIQKQLVSLASSRPKVVLQLQIRNLANYDEKNASQYTLTESDLNEFKKEKSLQAIMKGGLTPV